MSPRSRLTHHIWRQSIVHGIVTWRSASRSALVILCTLAQPAIAGAQATAQIAPIASEEIEPRVIGITGTTMVGLAGHVDRMFSSDEQFATQYTAQVDVSRFISRRVVARGVLTGSGEIGADAEERPSGVGVPALHVSGGLLFYLTPQSMLSAYTGGEYAMQITRRAGRDAGTIAALLGLQGAVSSRASVFVESGYGIGLRSGEDGERLSRYGGRIGIRLKF